MPTSGRWTIKSQTTKSLTVMPTSGRWTVKSQTRDSDANIGTMDSKVTDNKVFDSDANIGTMCSKVTGNKVTVMQTSERCAVKDVTLVSWRGGRVGWGGGGRIGEGGWEGGQLNPLWIRLSRITQLCSLCCTEETTAKSAYLDISLESRQWQYSSDM